MGKWRDRTEALHAGNRTRTAKACATDGTPSLWWRITDQLRHIEIENGQGDGICTRTVRVTGGDANCYITTLMNLEPLVGLAPTNTSLRNSPCCFWRHRGFENGALTWICTTSFRLRKPACRTNYTLRAIGIEPRLASVIGLAPIRPGLKDRLLDLLCIHGQKMVPEVGIAPTSPRLQRGANLPQLLGENGSPSRSSASEGWSSRQVMLLRLPVISRVLCF